MVFLHPSSRSLTRSVHEKSVRILLIALLILLLLGYILHVTACVLYDGPMVLTVAAGPTPDGIEAYLNNQLRLIHADFEYIGHSTHDRNEPGTSVHLQWYTSRLPEYASLGAEASILCLVVCDPAQTNVHSATVYIGSDKAIDSVIRRYAYSFHTIDVP